MTNNEEKLNKKVEQPKVEKPTGIPILTPGVTQQPTQIPVQSIPSGMPMSWYSAMGLTPEMLSQMGITPKIEYRPPPVQPSYAGQPGTYPGYGQPYQSNQASSYDGKPQGQPNVRPNVQPGMPGSPGVGQPGVSPEGTGTTAPGYPGGQYQPQGYPLVQPYGSPGGVGDLICGSRAGIWATVNGGLANMPFPVSLVHLVGMIREAMLKIEASWLNEQVGGVRKMTQGGMAGSQSGGFLQKIFGGLTGGKLPGGGLLQGLKRTVPGMPYQGSQQPMPGQYQYQPQGATPQGFQRRY